jgi:hypothetical protein
MDGMQGADSSDAPQFILPAEVPPERYPVDTAFIRTATIWAPLTGFLALIALLGLFVQLPVESERRALYGAIVAAWGLTALAGWFELRGLRGESHSARGWYVAMLIAIAAVDFVVLWGGWAVLDFIATWGNDLTTD